MNESPLCLSSLSQEMCDKHLNFTMCPLCDGVCDYWQLSSMCSTARASYLFDNHATVAFAIFMCLWGAFRTQTMFQLLIQDQGSQ